MIPTNPVLNEPITAVYVIWGGLYKCFYIQTKEVFWPFEQVVAKHFFWLFDT